MASEVSPAWRKSFSKYSQDLTVSLISCVDDLQISSLRYSFYQNEIHATVVKSFRRHEGVRQLCRAIMVSLSPHNHTTPHVHTQKTTHHTPQHTSHTHHTTPQRTTQHSTAPLTTDHDPARVSIKSGISVMSVISCGLIVFGINQIRNIRNLMRII